MEELIKDLMYENNIREEMAEYVADAQNSLANAEYGLENYYGEQEEYDEINSNIYDAKTIVDDIKKYKDMTTDEKYILKELQQRLENITENLEDAKYFHKDCGGSYYSYYGVSESDFH
jgi:hypothetical protein